MTPDKDWNVVFEYSRAQAIADGVLVDVTEQAKAMEEKWEEIRTGVAKERKNAKIDPFAEARAKLAAMPEGKEKEAAMKFATLLGIIK